MITHVAEAGEQRGRVVLWMGGADDPQQTAIEAAFRLAQAFQAEVESLFVADHQLFDFAALPFAREVPLSGRGSRKLTAEALARQMKAHASSLQRRVLAQAKAADVRAEAHIVRAEPVHALAEACARNGPWNVVTMGMPIRRGNGMSLTSVFETVHATTGVVVAGPKAQRTSGPVIAIIDDLDRTMPMMRAARRIAAATASEARLCLLDEAHGHDAWLEGQVRLALGATPAVKLDVVDMGLESPRSVAQTLRREGAGFVIARFGGHFVRDEEDVAPLAEILEGPLFLVR
ncbi:hypothetical protein W911_00730 [Hyphomicrobium nitrativorans NL23]|uniref:UspA domain-containing protein n=1 Tax=Hyphomicrobium nitrativorans NL23 TaxID=1029756 RepID=V5SH47_9HYPH|nr:universal stress protein [Hyphomicrobium nitrativorans]AHB49802.1 hypothetical protein W911_00730 [Hyphomicrobium nitrativorans NL23]